MDKMIADYVDKFSSFSDSISETIGSVNEYWTPDESPLIMLFSQIGNSLVAIFSELDCVKKELLFKYIEDGITSDNDELATAIATGLVEAIVTSTDANQYLWGEIEGLLGVKSKEHALAWRNFGAP
ncbi:hypothetical protein DEK44_00265 [Salmonella enterica]|nr:hypothetical protein [Salmonella enterica]EHF5600572.1 hypothetical protein [Salmonella enterica subsp. enterica serovar Muenchen]EBB7565011.1 hypothetical protein [Salmonella enterica]ECD9848584.1 hypothetical protein [Salmonella enterica]ECE5417734.1 hypothetical protein [Salmonella enterica]